MTNSQSQIAKEVDLSRLTNTELQIIKLIKEGYSSPQIAGFRDCSSRTVEKHRSNIIKKLKINSTQNALLIWISQNQDFFTT
ncbi:MAG: helix-turn-helix transcriptional regulator [Flavobacteriaceae bacterium]